MSGIGRHLASLNLFVEADGAYEITVASASRNLPGEAEVGLRPIDRVENLILAAARRMEARKRTKGTFRDMAA